MLLICTILKIKLFNMSELENKLERIFNNHGEF